MTWLQIVQIASAICGFVSAGFWLAAARTKMPTKLSSAYGGEVDMGGMETAFTKQSQRNSNAAWFAAGAIGFQAFAVLLQAVWGIDA